MEARCLQSNLATPYYVDIPPAEGQFYYWVFAYNATGEVLLLTRSILHTLS